MRKKKGGKAPKEKGARRVRAVVKMAKDLDLDAKVVPLSGAMDGFKSDVFILNDVYEVKAKKKGLELIFKALEQSPSYRAIFFVDRRKPIVVLKLQVFLEILKEVSDAT